jgi:glucosamine 6-phosphate synthetase-like amidotransferase/phosphosugar isomerase protein
MSKATNLAIVHNGMVRSQKKVKTDGQVDSEEVLRLIEMKDNVIEGIKYAEENYTGVSAYAMIGANMPDALFLVRSGNPIMLCYVRELDIVLFASTREILQASLQEYKCYMNFFVEKRHKHEAVFQGMEDNSYLLISRAGGKLTFKSEKFEKKGGYFSSVPVRYKYDKSQGDWMCEVD